MSGLSLDAWKKYRRTAVQAKHAIWCQRWGYNSAGFDDIG